jgi:hypothetical protein
VAENLQPMANDIQTIQNLIYEIRGQRVMLDRDLAELYGVSTGNLNKAVKRNIRRFPPDFMFQLTKEEFEFLKQSLIFQNGISNEDLKKQREKSQNHPPQLTNLNNHVRQAGNHATLLHTAYRRMSRAFYCLFLIVSTFFLPVVSLMKTLLTS